MEKPKQKTDMFKIAEKKYLAPDIWMLNIEAPRIARSALPGQFAIVRTDDTGERVPLTIADYDSAKGTVMLVIQAVGVSTKKLVALGEGDSIADFAGPLGHPSEFVGEPAEKLRGKRFLFVAGGVGAAPVYPQVKWLHEKGIPVDVIVGARTRDHLIMTDMLREVSGNLYIATDDGSEGFHGRVDGLLAKLVEEDGKHYDEVITIGPMIMMRSVSEMTKNYGLKTIASLNTLMIDGTGMCGACRVTVGGKTRFACVDGPEFDAHLIDFDEAMRRQRMYRDMETKAHDAHICNIGLYGKKQA